MHRRAPVSERSAFAFFAGVIVHVLGCSPGAGLGDDTDGTTGASTGADASSAAGTTGATAGGVSMSSSDPTVDPDTSGDELGESSGDAETVGTTGEPFPAPIPDECITDVTPGHHVFECDGLLYDLEVPEQCLDAACGMIFDVHGLAMSAQMQDACTNLRELGREHGFIVVQPNADPAPPASNWIPEVDDAKVFDAMERVAAAFHVDPDRWHFTGFSQGGFMTWRFACAHADVLASVAPAAACGGGFPVSDCGFVGEDVPSEPVDVLYMHGTADLVVNFACARPRRDAIIEHFGLGPAEPLTLDDELRRTRHSADGMTLEFVEHDYTGDSVLAGGHCMPGIDDPGDAPGQFVPASCDDPFLFVWGEELVQFFLDHPRG